MIATGESGTEPFSGIVAEISSMVNLPLYHNTDLTSGPINAARKELTRSVLNQSEKMR